MKYYKHAWRVLSFQQTSRIINRLKVLSDQLVEDPVLFEKNYHKIRFHFKLMRYA